MALLIKNIIFFSPHFIKPCCSALRLCSLRYGNYLSRCKIYSNVDNSRMISSFQKTSGNATISEAESNDFTCKEYRSPVGTGLYAADVISGGTLGAFLCLGGFVCMSLYTLGIAFYKLIGFVYLSTDNSVVKVSYMDFWGRRVDSYCPVEDVIPLSDLQENSSDIYIRFVQYSTPQVLYLTLRFGQITDKECFVKVFGKI